MKKTSLKQAILGYSMIVLGVAVFALYFYLLLEPLQLKYIVKGKHPSALAAIFFGMLQGILFASLTFIGNALTKDRFFGVKHTNFSFKELFKTKAYLIWAAAWAAVFILFTLFWAGGNF